MINGPVVPGENANSHRVRTASIPSHPWARNTHSSAPCSDTNGDQVTTHNGGYLRIAAGQRWLQTVIRSRPRHRANADSAWFGVTVPAAWPGTHMIQFWAPLASRFRKRQAGVALIQILSVPGGVKLKRILPLSPRAPA